MTQISRISAPIATLSDDALYSALCAVYDAYQTASWDDVDALQAEQAEIKAEMEARSLARSRAQLSAAGLPVAWARA